MKERSFDEMIAYFNRRVADMDISQDSKMELLGMVTALGFKHEKSAQQWIPVEERLPEDGTWNIWCDHAGHIQIARYKDDAYKHFYPISKIFRFEDAVAWQPLPEPYKDGE